MLSKKFKKQVQEFLEFSTKVYQYRCDVLTDSKRVSLKEAITSTESVLKSADQQDVVEQKIEVLEKELKQSGGTFYPKRFFSEHIEMFLVATILVLGIRSFFIQPFMIPTNSMYPTYSGMNHEIHTEETQPSGAGRIFRLITQGASYYNLKTMTSGDLQLPVILALDDNNKIQAMLNWQFKYNPKVIPARKWLIFPSKKWEYMFIIGSQELKMAVPREFSLEKTIHKTFYPEHNSLSDGLISTLDNHTYQSLRRDLRKTRYIQRTMLLKKDVKAGESIMNFSILSGDALFVDRFTYNFRKPQVGEPFVFRTANIHGIKYRSHKVQIGESINLIADHSNMTVSELRNLNNLKPDQKLMIGQFLRVRSSEIGKYYIKRLVGKAGDELEIKGKALYSNGKVITGADAFEKNATLSDGYLGYESINRLAAGKKLKIADKSYFAMGDNSPHSYDSRSWSYEEADPQTEPWGFVPEKEVIGKALFIYYPFTKRWGLGK